MKACKVKGRGEQIAPAQTPENRSFHARQYACDEYRRGRVVANVGRAQNLMQCAGYKAVAGQMIVDAGETERMDAMTTPIARHMGDRRTQILEDGIAGHSLVSSVWQNVLFLFSMSPIAVKVIKGGHRP